MDFFSHPVIAVILLIGVLVFVHEAGHFVVGKVCKIAVEIFSIGFGPAIFSFKRNETTYRLSAIPLGGYVKFYGSTRRETVPEELRGKEFFRASVGKRFLTVIAGPAANFLLAILVYAGMFTYGIPDLPPIVGEVMPGSPAEKAGLQFGDVVKAVDGEEITTWKQLQKVIMLAPQEKLDFVIDRHGQQVAKSIVPAQIHDEEMLGTKQRGQIGISPGHVPSIVTIKDYDGIAAKAGLETGDEITAIHVGENDIAVEYWRALPAIFSEAAVAGQIQLKVKKHGDGGEVLIEVPTIGMPSDPAQFDEWLGWTNSQLTIAEPGELNQDVLHHGDLIVEWDGEKVGNLFDLSQMIMTKQKPRVQAVIQRGRELLPVSVTMKPVEVQKAEGRATQYILESQFLGEFIHPQYVVEQYSNPLTALAKGTERTIEQTGMIAMAVAGLFTGDVPLQSLGGPISIAKVASDSVKLGWMTFFGSLALISINLGLLNLFPIPILDGGQIVLLGAEKVRRRPLDDIALENFQKIGFVLVFALVIMATYNDLSRFWLSMMRGVTGLFGQ
jgi:regulator of sigma E protease